MGEQSQAAKASGVSHLAMIFVTDFLVQLNGKVKKVSEVKKVSGPFTLDGRVAG